MSGRHAPGAPLWSTTTNIAAASNAVSGWVDVSDDPVLAIGRKSTGGTYVFEVDWSRDGVTSDFTETVTVADGTTVTKHAGAPFARFRVRNTDGVNAFTAHVTAVTGWQV